jgi:hypothetical protein
VLKRIATLIVATALVVGCSDPTPSEGDPATMTATPKSTIAAAAKPRTTVSERLAHWQEVVRSMTCPELAQLERRSLALRSDDQADSLIAIHNRRAELHC